MPNLINLTEDKAKEIESFLIDRFNELKSQRDTLDDKVIKDLKLYNSVPIKEKEEWESNYSTPYIFSIIKSIFPRLYFSIFGNTKWLKVTAENSDIVGQENKITSFFVRMADRIGFRKVAQNAIKRAMIYPVHIFKTVFDMTTGLPLVANVDYFDYWQEISVSEIEDAPDCFNRVVRSKSQTLLRTKNGFYYPDIQDRLMKSKFPTDIADKQATALNLFLGDKNIVSVKSESNTAKKNLENFEVLEYYGYYDVDDDGVEEKVIFTLVNRQVLARAIIDTEEKKPFIKMVIDKEPIGFYGKSYIMMLKNLQNMLDDVVNSRFDNLNLILNKMFYIRRGSTVDYETLFSAPGNVIEVDDLSDIKEVQFTNTLRDSYEAEQMIRSDMQMISGMIDYGSTPEMMKGIGSTATGMSIMTSDAVSKFREPLDNVKEGILSALKRVLELTRKYSNNLAMREVRSLDAMEKYSITPDDLEYDYLFTINIKNFLPDKQQTLQNLTMLLNIIGQVPGVNIIAYIKNIFDLMDEIKNPDEILPAMASQTQEAINEIREKQNRDKTKDNVNAIVNKTIMQAAGVPTSEDTLIQPKGDGTLPSPLNPQAKMPTEQNSIQEILSSNG